MSVRPDELRLEATIRVDSLPPEGKAVHVASTPAQREAIADQLGITAVERLEADLAAKRFRGGIRVAGRLRARIEQPCVVSLVPVHQDIAVEVERIYLPEPGGKAEHSPSAEVFVDLEGEDLPDHFDGREADLADMLVESLALEIDPYPHAPGASLETAGDGGKTEDESPFAALKALRDQADND